MNRCMSLRTATLAVAVLILLGLGLRASAASAVPFKGRVDVVITGVVDLSPTSRQLTATGTGQATHLGRFTRTETLNLDPTNGTFTGTLTFTAANGDLLNADFTGQFTSPTGSSAEGTYEFKGGTGRFQNASGSATFKATADGT